MGRSLLRPQSTDVKSLMTNIEGAKKHLDEKEQIQDGELKPWLVVGTAASIISMSFGMCNSYDVYRTYYEEK